MTYRVHNLQEGSRSGNWIKYWEDATRQKAGFCHKLGCLSWATDGAHVQLSNSSDRRWWIVPLCHQCNCQFGAEFTVTGPLVSATDPNVILW